MSTTVALRVGTFSVQTGRNEWYENHAELFQPTDLVAFGTSDTVEEFALRKPVSGRSAQVAAIGYWRRNSQAGNRRSRGALCGNARLGR